MKPSSDIAMVKNARDIPLPTSSSAGAPPHVARSSAGLPDADEGRFDLRDALHRRSATGRLLLSFRTRDDHETHRRSSTTLAARPAVHDGEHAGRRVGFEQTSAMRAAAWRIA